MTDVRTPADLDAAVLASEGAPVLLFKHSRTCPISAMVHERMKGLVRPGDPDVYRIVVQDARPVSGAVAERFGIRHESPQAILLVGGAPVYYASHHSIAPDAIRAAARTTPA